MTDDPLYKLSIATINIKSICRVVRQKIKVELCFGHTHNHTHLYSVLSQMVKERLNVDKINNGRKKGRKKEEKKRKGG